MRKRNEFRYESTQSVLLGLGPCGIHLVYPLEHCGELRGTRLPTLVCVSSVSRYSRAVRLGSLSRVSQRDLGSVVFPAPTPRVGNHLRVSGSFVGCGFSSPRLGLRVGGGDCVVCAGRRSMAPVSED